MISPQIQFLRRSSQLTVMGIALSVIITIGSGCRQEVDQQLLDQRQRYALADEPAGALNIEEVRAAVAQEAQEVVLMGRVGADEATTWEPGRAAFVIVDPVAGAHDHGDGHDHDNCPFCQAEEGGAPDPTALVQVVDDSGAVVPIDARKLLELSANQIVVVQGTAQVDAIGNLIVSATGVYARR